MRVEFILGFNMITKTCYLTHEIMIKSAFHSPYLGYFGGFEELKPDSS